MMVLPGLRFCNPLPDQLASFLSVRAVPEAAKDRYQKTGDPSRVLGNEPKRELRPCGSELRKEVIKHRKGREIIRLRLRVFKYLRPPLSVGICVYGARKVRGLLSSFLFYG